MCHTCNHEAIGFCPLKLLPLLYYSLIQHYLHKLLTSSSSCVRLLSWAASSSFPADCGLGEGDLLGLMEPGLPSASCLLLCITFSNSGLPRFAAPPLEEGRNERKKLKSTSPPPRNNDIHTRTVVCTLAPCKLKYKATKVLGHKEESSNKCSTASNPLLQLRYPSAVRLYE